MGCGNRALRRAARCMHPGTGVQNRKQRHAIGFTLPLRKAAQGASITGEFAIISAAKRCNPHERVKPMYGTAEIAQKRPPLIACGVVRKLVPEHMGKHAGLLQRRVIYERPLRQGDGSPPTRYTGKLHVQSTRVRA